ncbi:hypothetical protein Y1Q_0004497 [Alligator mississippiensis]|uniref:Uncharacterized protein n=1 Tax=Alligator mississippiensis TaxID=8496 RepID=A0A151NY49_ALLMI|nr:hypothetical protein Y1Q_0004497 [Alligator mississippiensis]
MGKVQRSSSPGRLELCDSIGRDPVSLYRFSRMHLQLGRNAPVPPGSGIKTLEAATVAVEPRCPRRAVHAVPHKLTAATVLG